MLPYRHLESNLFFYEINRVFCSPTSIASPGEKSGLFGKLFARARACVCICVYECVGVDADHSYHLTLQSFFLHFFTFCVGLYARLFKTKVCPAKSLAVRVGIYARLFKVQILFSQMSRCLCWALCETF